MRRFAYIAFLLVFYTTALVGQEVLTPASHFLKDEILFSEEEAKVVGEGYFPISYSKANFQLPEKDTLKQRNWIVRKLLKEHFVQIQKKDYFLAIDPLVNLAIGKEVLQEVPGYLFQNTRGAQAFGQIRGLFSFYTAFYENQARFNDYETEYFKSRGELYPKNDSVYYRANAVIPNGGRTKPFKENAFDYASAVSYIRFTPLKQLSFQFGNMPRFYGWGYRSMLMSDNSHNYTHLTIDWEITEGLTYTFSRGTQFNLFRKVYTKLVERPYERKGIGVHYLSYQVVPSLTVGLFESTVFLRDEGTSYRRVNNSFYNPFIGLNTFVLGMETESIKNIFGVNLAWKPHAQHMLYAQAATDSWKSFQYGLQLGYRGGNLFGVKRLNFQVEYNQASSQLYAANNERMAYTHFNLPLAHPLGNGFKELLVRTNYYWKGIYIDLTGVYYSALQNMPDKSNLFSSKEGGVFMDVSKTVLLNAEVGYELNRATQLRVFAATTYRMNSVESLGKKNNGAVVFGIKSALTNNYFDF